MVARDIILAESTGVGIHLAHLSTRGSVELVRKAKAKKYTEELWTAIGDANTCQACSDADAMGWQPMGTFAEPGSGEVVKGETFCEGLSSCRCEKSYR